MSREWGSEEAGKRSAVVVTSEWTRVTTERSGIFLYEGKKQFARCILLFKLGMQRLTHKSRGLGMQTAAGRHVAALSQRQKNALEEQKSLR